MKDLLFKLTYNSDFKAAHRLINTVIFAAILVTLILK